MLFYFNGGKEIQEDKALGLDSIFTLNIKGKEECLHQEREFCLHFPKELEGRVS